MKNRKSSEAMRQSRVLLLVCSSLIAGIASSGCSTLGSVVTAPELCQDWRRITRSKNDRLTQGTAAQIEASNLSRVEWGCDRKANKAAS